MTSVVGDFFMGEIKLYWEDAKVYEVLGNAYILTIDSDQKEVVSRILKTMFGTTVYWNNNLTDNTLSDLRSFLFSAQSKETLDDLVKVFYDEAT